MIRIKFESETKKEVQFGIFINDSTQPFTDQILKGEKTIETRNVKSLDKFVGQRVGIVRTGKGKATLVGFATVDKDITYETKKSFNQDYNRRSGGKKYAHLIKPNNKDFNFDANTHGYKMGYYLTNVEKCDPWEIPSSARRYGRTYVDIRGYSKKGKSNKKNEAFYRKNKYKTMDFYGNEVTREEEIYDPTYDSKYKRLIRKPLNTLTMDEVKYIYAIETARYMQQVRQFDTIEDAIEYAMWRYDDEDIQECVDWLHTLSFPLTVYRAVYDRTELNNVSGKNHDICWSTNPEIYTNENSSFSRCNKIVKAEINQNIINVPTTIERFLSYTGKRKSRGFGEFEINLKPNFKQSDLMNLQLIDKKDLMR